MKIPNSVNSGGGLIGTLLSSVMGLFASIEPSSEDGTSLQASARRVLGAFQSRLKVRACRPELYHGDQLPVAE